MKINWKKVKKRKKEKKKPANLFVYRRFIHMLKQRFFLPFAKRIVFHSRANIYMYNRM